MLPTILVRPVPIPVSPTTVSLCSPRLLGNAVSGTASCPHPGRVPVLRLRAPPSSACRRHGNQHHLSVTCTGAAPAHANRKWCVGGAGGSPLTVKPSVESDVCFSLSHPDHMILPVSLVFGHVTIATSSMTFYDCGAVSRLNQSSQYVQIAIVLPATCHRDADRQRCVFQVSGLRRQRLEL